VAVTVLLPRLNRLSVVDDLADPAAQFDVDAGDDTASMRPDTERRPVCLLLDHGVMVHRPLDTEDAIAELAAPRGQNVGAFQSTYVTSPA
jgi:hypothetical protein